MAKVHLVRCEELPAMQQVRDSPEEINRRPALSILPVLFIYPFWQDHLSQYSDHADETVSVFAEDGRVNAVLECHPDTHVIIDSC